MSTQPIIMKFGGTSVADVQAFERVAQLILNHSHSSPVVIVSAMSGVTDALLAAFELAASGKVGAASQELEVHFIRHLGVAYKLTSAEELSCFRATIEQTRSQLEQLFNKATAQPGSAALKDLIVSLGEHLSSQLLTAVLRAQRLAATHIDARDVMVTNEEYGQAGPLMVETSAKARDQLLPLIAAGQIPVLGGFIAATRKGITTTLGRGGSDYSAAILGAVLNAQEIQIWTDVSGVLTADPQVVPNATTVPVLSYQEAAELAYFGAKVLHPKTIQPAVECGIPVRVCNSRAPGEPSTSIVGSSAAAPRTVKAIAYKNGITTLQVTSARMLGAYGFLRALFAVFEGHRTVVDVVTTSEVSVSLSIDNASTLSELIPELERLGSVEVEAQRTIVSIIGEGLRHTPGIAARVFSALRDINVSMISFGASSVNLSFMVDERFACEAIRRLHHACFETDIPFDNASSRAGEEVAA